MHKYTVTHTQTQLFVQGVYKWLVITIVNYYHDCLVSYYIRNCLQKIFFQSNLLKANFRDKKNLLRKKKIHWEFLKPQNNDIQITKGDQEAKQVLRISLHPSHHLCKRLDGQSGPGKDETKCHDEATLSHQIILIIKGKS